ncbi:MAG: hypothetical protein IKH78_08065 [Ruminococcus sp.]|uniref:hypothetical protein n=1 Tax=Ralstonia pseudosolanacearum TaxID=1310165 RepID=UPI003D17F5EA|nr:hypothetical protein [Ruminococcus sp.]
MTPEELYTLLSAKFPTCYYDFSEVKEADRPKNPPYCAILEDPPRSIKGDDKTYHLHPEYTVELYTSRADYISESTLEEIFDANDIYFEKAGKVYLREEKKMQIIYKI